MKAQMKERLDEALRKLHNNRKPLNPDELQALQKDVSEMALAESIESDQSLHKIQLETTYQCKLARQKITRG